MNGKKCHATFSNNIFFIFKSISSDCTDYDHFSIRSGFIYLLFSSFVLILIFLRFENEKYVRNTLSIPIVEPQHYKINLMGYFTFKSDSCRFPVSLSLCLTCQINVCDI